MFESSHSLQWHNIWLNKFVSAFLLVLHTCIYCIGYQASWQASNRASWNYAKLAPRASAFRNLMSTPAYRTLSWSYHYPFHWNCLYSLTSELSLLFLSFLYSVSQQLCLPLHWLRHHLKNNVSYFRSTLENMFGGYSPVAAYAKIVWQMQ